MVGEGRTKCHRPFLWVFDYWLEILEFTFLMVMHLKKLNTMIIKLNSGIRKNGIQILKQTKKFDFWCSLNIFSVNTIYSSSYRHLRFFNCIIGRSAKNSFSRIRSNRRSKSDFPLAHIKNRVIFANEDIAEDPHLRVFIRVIIALPTKQFFVVPVRYCN